MTLKAKKGVDFGAFKGVNVADATALQDVPAFKQVPWPHGQVALSVKHPSYGATGDGSTVDRTAIQNAIDAAVSGAAPFTAGPVDVVVPAGTYMVDTKISVKTGVFLDIKQGATIKAVSGGSSNPLIDVVGDSNCGVKGFGTVDVNNRTNSIGVSFTPASGTITRGLVEDITIKNTTNSTVRCGNICRGLKIQRIKMDTCANGIQVLSVAGQQLRQVWILDNEANNVGTNIIQVAGSNDHEFASVMVCGNIVHDCQNVGANGPIPIEVGRCDNVLIANNVIGGNAAGTNANGTRGISTANNWGIVAVGNVLQGQTTYAFEWGANHNFAIVGNEATDCATFMVDTISAGCTDGVIMGNTHNGTGLAGSQTADLIKLANTCKNILIEGNTFHDWEFQRSAIRIGETGVAEDVHVRENIFVVEDANTPIQVVAVRKCIRSSVKGNIIRVKRNLAAGDDTSDAIQITMDASSADIEVEDNHIQYTGTTSSAANHSGIGHGSTGAATLPGLVVKNNTVKNGARGIRLGSLTSADQIVVDNATSTCTAADNLNAACVFYRGAAAAQYEGTAAPTAGTWVRGQIVWNKGSSAGNPLGWVCTVAGTPGTWVAIGTIGAGTKISALTAVTTPAGTDEIPVNQVGTTKKLTLAQINSYVDPSSNGSVAAQTLGTGDTYVTGSDVTFAAGRLKAASYYRAIIDMTKTAAGVATAVITLRMGTLGTTGDAAICTFTFPTAQTGAIDNGRFSVYANLRTVGAGTSATVEGVLVIERTNTTTGFLSTGGLQFMAPIRVLSSGFNSTTVTKIGLSINAGASSAWTTQLVQADVKNLS